MNVGHFLRASGRSSSRHFSAALRRPSAQACRHEGALHVVHRQHVRYMGIFQEFRKRLQGEVQSNPELQRSIKELKEKAGDLRHRTKETTQQIYKRVGAARVEAESKASQVSALVKEKVHEAKEKVSEATTQVKETVSSFKSPEDSQQAGKASEGLDGKPLEGETSPNNEAKKERVGESQEQGNKTGPIYRKFSHGFRVLLNPALSFYERVRRTRLADLAKSGYNIFLEELTTTSSKRAKAKMATRSTAPRSSSTAIVPVIKKKSVWEKRWDSVKEKFQAHPVYKRFRGVKEHPVVVKSQEIAEDLRERWETSDSPMVHKIQDLNDSLFGETATALALKEIRQRDPTFTFPDFLAEVQESLRPVLQAYMKGDLVELQKRCSREVVDRCRAERKAYESQGIFFDNKILHISDVELKETKLLGNVPIIIVAFQTQQIYCVRDKNGKITQGAKDDIHTVYYAWAMQQVINEDLEEGEIFPRWQLREMQQLGIQAII